MYIGQYLSMITRGYLGGVGIGIGWDPIYYILGKVEIV